MREDKKQKEKEKEKQEREKKERRKQDKKKDRKKETKQNRDATMRMSKMTVLPDNTQQLMQVMVGCLSSTSSLKKQRPLLLVEVVRSPAKSLTFSGLNGTPH